MTQRLNRETWVWDQLDDPNVLPFLGISNDAGEAGSAPALITPLCTNGHVLTFLTQNPDADRLHLVSHFQRVLTVCSFLSTGCWRRERFGILTFKGHHSW
jgi:hypothetical protein